MCVAIPSRVVELGDSTATVERFGERIVVSLLMLAEPVELGDYLIIQARSFAVEKLELEDAEASLALFREWLALSGAEESEAEDPGLGPELRGEASGR
jgi:hydrogenase expression/formation protein HypC